MAKRARAQQQEEPTGDDADTVMVGGIEPEHETEVEVNVELPDREQQEERQTQESDAETAYDEEEGMGYDEEEPRKPSHRQRRNRARRQQLSAKDAQIAELQRQLEQVGRAVTGLAAGHVGLTQRNLDAEIAAQQQTIRLAGAEFERLLALEASERPRGELDRVMQLRDEAAYKVGQLMAARQRLAQGGHVQQPAGAQPQQAPRQQQQPQYQPDPRADHFAGIFESRHPWYDPEGDDEDSVIVRAIGEKLEAEGYQAGTPLLWRELEKRVRARGLGAGEHSNGGAGMDGEQEREQPRRGIPPTGAVRSTGQPGKVTMTLSKMQRDILEEEGLMGPSYDGLRGEDKKAADERRARYINAWRKGMKSLRVANQ
ncbi:MAG: hypothetical protein ACOY4R_27735 [Pseudomonadota bacterium]